MYGRNHLDRGAPHRQPNNNHHHPLDEPRLRHLARAHQQQQQQQQHHQSTILQDRIAVQHREIQTLLLENQRLGAAHLALKDELALEQRDLRQLSVLAKDVKAERDAQVRDVYERSLKLDAEVRAVDAMSAELVQVKTDVKQLIMRRQELNDELRVIDDNIVRARQEAKLVDVVKSEIEALRRQIQRGRAAVECEKKNKAINSEQDQIMQKNLILMARELNKLHAELAKAEIRTREAAASTANPGPAYAGNYANSEVGYGGTTDSNPSGMQKVEGGSDNCHPFVSGALSSAPCDTEVADADG